MTSPELLKRNLKILEMYDSGDYGRKAIMKALDLSSVQVVINVLRRRRIYESDPRISDLFHKEQLTTIDNFQPHPRQPTND